MDVDTDRGTRIGVPRLLQLFSELNITATFLFSLGPDNTGRAIKRIFRPGFVNKVRRSGVISMYGIRTLLNGTLLPGPSIAQRNKKTIYAVHQAKHEVGIHCYDHIRWQDGLDKMSKEDVFAEFAKARQEFENIFQFPAQTAGAAGWQANAFSLAAYDNANLLYGSDTRGTHPFFPQMGGIIFKTLQIPTTLPTLDELLGRPEYPLEKLMEFYLTHCNYSPSPNILTIHAEIEGMKYLSWFKNFLQQAKLQNIEFVTLAHIAEHYLENRDQIPVCELISAEVSGRSGKLATQG